MTSRPVWLSVLLLVGGCATTADLQKVQRDQREMRALLADTQVSVERLRRDVDALQNRQGDARGGSPGAMRELDRRVTALDQRLKALEGSPRPLELTPTPLPGTEQPIEVQLPHSDGGKIAIRAEAAALQGGAAPAAYRSAMDLYKRGQCDQAVLQFRQFIRESPTSEYADNAQYWVGECYYGKKDYNRAIIEFNEVILKYPKGDRVPSALLALATSFADSGDKIDARLILQKLIGEYPRSEEATVGRQKLQSLTE